MISTTILRAVEKEKLKRRRHKAMYGIIALLLAESTKGKMKKNLCKRLNNLRRRKSSNCRRERANKLAEVEALPDNVFKQMFRMKKADVEELLIRLKATCPELEDTEWKRLYASRNIKNNEGSPISLKTKLLATIRYLAGGSKWDICLVFGIGFSTLFADARRGVIYPILDAIDQTFSIGLDLNEDVLDKQAAEFANICPTSASVFNGVVLAVDGWVMRTRKPYASEVNDDVMKYRNRKGCWGIVVLALKLNFICFPQIVVVVDITIELPSVQRISSRSPGTATRGIFHQ
jgi:hypothetical protein